MSCVGGLLSAALLPELLRPVVPMTSRCDVCGTLYGHRLGCAGEARERAHRRGQAMPVILPDDYPTAIPRASMRALYGDSNPWVQWLMSYAPEVAHRRLEDFRYEQGAFKIPKCRLGRKRRAA